MNSIELVFGLIALFLTITIPGYFLTLGFFPNKNEIDSIERLTFSLVFSIAFLPVFVLIENMVFSIPVNFTSSIGTVLLLIIIGLLSWMVRTQKIIVPNFLYFVLPKIEKKDSVDLFFVSFFKNKK
ncbi:MAG: hypothetical protein COX63_00290 [Candidatus Diapherotrites archaeon CG_4_10_14_0_2_um_filter_31_5]|nr:MAG: hypothetical protein COX63_00290 [Candidatus Diapherotrites archaeon CG_4_10_14_0_2_um_filter_31_5]